MIVVGGLALIDDDVRRAALGGNQRNGRRWKYRQRRSKGKHQIGPGSGGGRPIEVCRSKRLAEADCRRFQESAARASRRLSGRFEPFEVRFGIARRFAPQALDNPIAAVQLDQQVG